MLWIQQVIVYFCGLGRLQCMPSVVWPVESAAILFVVYLKTVILLHFEKILQINNLVKEDRLLFNDR